DDLVPGRVVGVVVDPHHDREVLALGRRGDDHLLGAAGDVLAGVVGVGEPAGRFDHHVDAELTPGQIRGIPLGHDLDRLVADPDHVTVGRDVLRQVAEHAVVLEQVRHGRDVTEIVRRDDLYVAGGLVAAASGRVDGTPEVAADPAESVDAHPN